MPLQILYVCGVGGEVYHENWLAVWLPWQLRGSIDLYWGELENTIYCQAYADILTKFHRNAPWVVFFKIFYFKPVNSSPGPKGHGELLSYQCVRRASSVNNIKKLLNIFFYKTTGPTVLKFYMKNDLSPGS